jgi:hypothetical protein
MVKLRAIVSLSDLKTDGAGGGRELTFYFHKWKNILANAALTDGLPRLLASFAAANYVFLLL